MKRIVRHALLLLSAGMIIGCSAETAQGPHGLSTKVFPMPSMPAVVSVADFESVDAEVAALQPTIGRYPPRFNSEKQREETYTRWSKALISAHALNARGDRLEEKLHLLSELYRQGHNLDVQGAADEALANIERCLELYPRSRSCNLSASYFFLSTTLIPSRLERSERSLAVLRELAAPGLDDDAEAGFIWLAVYREDRAEASRLIDRYLLAFPQSDRATMFRKIQSAERIVVRESGGP